MERHFFMISRALNARKRKIFALFFALAASIGLMNAKVTWNSSNISDLKVRSYQSYSKEGVTLSANSGMVEARWQDFGDESMDGISFNANETGGYTFSNTLGKNFTKIEMTLTGPGGWDMANLGNGWSFYWDYMNDKPATVTWTGNAATVDLLKDASDFNGERVKSIVFYFEGDSQEPAPATTVVTITQNDFPGMDVSFTKDGVTVSAGNMIDGDEGNIMGGGSFSTTLGNFTKIEVTADDVSISGTGWTGTYGKKTWTGNASSVSFSGNIVGMGMGTTLKFTIEAAAPAPDPTEGIVVPEGGEIFVLTDSIMKREEGEFMFAYDGEGWVTECQFMVWHTQTMNAESRWNRTTMNMVGTDGPEFGSNKANVVRLEINFASTTGGGALAEGWSLSGNKYIWTGSSKSVRFYHTGATISGITSVVYVFDGKCHRDPQRFTTSVLAEDLIVGDTLAMGAQLISEVYGGFYLDANRVRYHGVVQTQNFRSTFSQLGAVSKHGAMDNEYPENRGCLEPINENGELGEEWIVISLDPLHIAGIGTASAVTNTCYTSEVDYAALEPGDTIAYGASIINTPEKVWFRANRMQRSNSGETFIIEDDRYMEGSYGTFGKNGVITDKYGTTYAPINEQGTLGGKWVVVFYSPLTIAGIGEPAIELTLSDKVSILGMPVAGITDLGNNNYEVEPGTQFQIQAAAAPEHYNFVGWSDLASTDPNYSANPRTITMTSDLTIQPIYAIDTYIVTLASNDETMGTLRVEGGGGSNIGPKEEINIYHGVVGEHYQVLGEYSGSSWIGVGGNDNKTITVESLNGEIIDNITLEVYMPSHWTGYSIAATSGNVSGDVANYQDLVITNINATSVTLSRVGEGENGGSVLFSEIIVNGRDEQQGGQAGPITVTITNKDFPSEGNSFTKDGVTVSAETMSANYIADGTFSTTLGNITRIQVTSDARDASGDGWVGSGKTWVGNASSVPFSGYFSDMYGVVGIKFVITIEPTAAPAAATGIVDNGDGTYTVDWGTEMSIIAEPKEGYMLASWNGEPALSDTLKQTVEGALSINATFKHIPAVITLPEGVSIVGMPIEGITSKGEGVYEVEYGTEFQISADIIPEHYHFGHWADLDAEDAMYAANPRTIVAGENLTIEPIFAIDTYTLTLATNDPTMGIVSVEGAGQGGQAEPITVTFTNLNNVVKVVENITLPHTFSCDYTNGNGELDLIIQESYNETGGRCSTSRQWPWGGNDNEVVVGHDGNNHFVTINAPFVGTSFMSGYYDGSSFGNFYYSFHITTAAAAPAAASGIVDNGDGTYTVDYGTEIAIVAKPAENHYLVSWNGEPATSDTLKLTMNGELAVNATFAHVPYTITLPEGVSIVGMPIDGITAKGEGVYEVEPGTEFQISADGAPEHYHFDHWADLTAEDAMYAANPRTIVADKNLTIEPFYAIDTYTLTLATNDETMGTLRIAGIGEEGGLQEPSAQLIVPESWSSEVGVTITAADLPGFVASTEEAVKALPVPTEGSVFVIYNFKDDGGVEAVTFENGEYVRTTSSKVDRASASYYSNQGMTFLYTTAAGQAGQGGEGVDIVWDADFWNGIQAYMNGEDYVHANNSKDGITITFDGGDFENGLKDGKIKLDNSDNKLIFTSTVGKIKKIKIRGYASYKPEGWSRDGGLMWEGTPSDVVELFGQATFVHFVSATFTIEPDATTGKIVDNGDGTYTVDWGTELTFVAKAAEGYHVQSWSNGAEVNDLVEATQTITMTEALDLSALFAENPIITLATNDSTMGIVTLAGAGKQLTVNGDGGSTNQNVPIRTAGASDNRTLNQSIYPAALLSGIAGESISGMTFYISDPSAKDNTATYVVKLMETEQAAFSDAVAVNTESATTVYTGTLDVTGNTMDIVFDQPYAYNGGNLLVQFGITEVSAAHAVTFFSVFASQGGTFQQYYHAGFEEMRYYMHDFLAKTTFICGDNKDIPGVIDLGNGQYNVLPGTELTFVAQPAKDYHLVSWNGEPAVSDTMKVTVTEEISLSAQFKHDTYILTVEGAEVEIAKFADGTTDAVVLNPGTLVGVQEGDSVKLTTTATFSSANVADNLDITLHYEIEVIEDGIYDNEYALAITDSIYPIKGAIIEPMTPDEEAAPEDEEAEVKEGLEIYAYGYCNGSSYSINYYLKSGQPDQYKIEFADSRFTNVAYEETSITGREGTIDIEIPVDLPTGDYSMTITFRDSRYEWLESNPITVSFHVNLPETYVVALFDNVIAVVDTCECLTDIQWYWRADASQTWQAIEGATGYYYKMEGGLTGEFFIKAKMNGIDTYTCPQDDMTLYGETSQAAVRAYPNPVRNNTTVTIEGSDALQHSLRIVNLMGNTMMNGSFEGNTTTVEMGAYPQGNYMISVDGIVVKVIKK